MYVCMYVHSLCVHVTQLYTHLLVAQRRKALFYFQTLYHVVHSWPQYPEEHTVQDSYDDISQCTHRCFTVVHSTQCVASMYRDIVCC